MENIQKIVLVLALVLAAVFIILSSTENKISQVCIQENCFKVEIAQTLEERQQGLMNREFLAEDSGMLFIFPESDEYGFWMKNTLIPLDIIWINQDLEIVHIENAEPCESEPCQIYQPMVNALFVLEINHGLAEKLNIHVGDKVVIKNG